MSEKGLWRPLETMGLKFGWGSNLEVTGFFVAIWVGPKIKLFSKNNLFFVKWGPSKNSGPNPKSFCFWSGFTLGPPQTSASPPPWANPRYVPVTPILQSFIPGFRQNLLLKVQRAHIAGYGPPRSPTSTGRGPCHRRAIIPARRTM